MDELQEGISNDCVLEVWAPDLKSATSSRPIDWLWQGYVARGATTLLTSQWKSGKTTLVALLLARMGQGRTLAGLAVKAGKAAVVTDEGRDLWARRTEALGLSEQVCFFCQPFGSRPTEAEFSRLAARLEVTIALVRRPEVIPRRSAELPGLNGSSILEQRSNRWDDRGLAPGV